LRVFIPPGFGPSDPAVYIPGIAGDQHPGSPQRQGTFNVRYEAPLDGRCSLDLNYGLAAIGNVLTKTVSKAGCLALGGYTVHAAWAQLRNGPWTLAVYGQNLTNKVAVTGVRSNRLFAQTVEDENGDPVRVRAYSHDVLRPREIGFRFSYDLDL